MNSVKRFIFGLFATVAVGLMLFGQSYASASDQNTLFSEGIGYFNTGTQTCNDTSLSASSGSNLDYAGRPILNPDQLSTIDQNKNVYEQAAEEVDIPWQMLAVIHLRETGLSLINPGNGQGLYQFYDEHGGPYPAGPVTTAEFLRQTILAAQFLKAKAASNFPDDQTLTSTSNANTIKDTFYSYNGRGYAQQAAENGFDPNTQAFEGSPYVMNKADAKRDPSALPANETSWGQIKTDNGGISYPANNDYGAYVVYASLAGTSTSGDCSGAVNCNNSVSNATANLSQVRQNVVCISQQELQKWQTGALTAKTGLLTYTQGVYEQWCADFVSWVFDQAKYPLKPEPDWRVPSVSSVQAIGESSPNFHYHANDGSYTPQPGDMGLFGGGHIVIVTGVSAKQITTIGGDEGDPKVSVNNYGTLDPPSTSIVQQDQYNNYLTSGLTGFVTPD